MRSTRVAALLSLASAGARASLCTVAPAPEVLSRHYICGSLGSISLPDLIQRFEPPSNALADCYLACHRSNECISFSWNSKHGICETYRATLLAMGFGSNAGTGIAFWDQRHCFSDPVCDSSICTATNTLSTSPTIRPAPPLTPTEPRLCNNQGIEWAYYHNDQGADVDRTYSNFDPTHFKNLKPNATGVSNYLGDIFDNDIGVTNIYGTTLPGNKFVVDHHGLFFPKTTGTYTFIFSGADDIALLWIGGEAIEAWDRSNADLISTKGQGGHAEVQHTFDEAGAYVPIRLMLGQAGGAGGVYLTVLDPDGKIVVSPGIDKSTYLLRFACT